MLFLVQQVVVIRAFPDQFGATLRTTLFLTGDSPLMGCPIITFGAVAVAPGAHILTISSHCHPPVTREYVSAVQQADQVHGSAVDSVPTDRKYPVILLPAQNNPDCSSVHPGRHRDGRNLHGIHNRVPSHCHHRSSDCLLSVERFPSNSPSTPMSSSSAGQ